MTTTSSRFFDELAKLMSNAAGAAQGARREFDSLVRTQIERAMSGMDVVQREEFEAVREMALKARAENRTLEARIAALEAQLGTAPAEGAEEASEGRAKRPPRASPKK